MAVRQRSKSSYEITLELGRSRDPTTKREIRDRTTVTVKATSRAEAEAVERDLIAEIAAGTYRKTVNMTVGELLDLYLENYASTKAPATYQAYKTHARNHLIPHLGHIRLSQLTALDVVRAQRAWRDAGHALPHVCRGLLASALRRARTWGLMARNPLADLEWPDDPRTAKPILTPDAARAFVDLALDPAHRPWGIAAVTKLHAGLRVGELCGLCWPDLTLDDPARLRANVSRQLKRYVASTLKATGTRPITASHGDRRRTLAVVPVKSLAGRGGVRLSSDLALLLEEHRTLQEIERAEASAAGRRWPVYRDGDGHVLDLVFRGPDGRAVEDFDMRVQIAKLLRKAGAVGLTPHALRRTMGALVFGLGASTKEVQDRLRHGSHATTEAYYHELLPDVQDATTERYASLLRPASKRELSRARRASASPTDDISDDNRARPPSPHLAKARKTLTAR